ncbi:MAG TPA: CapA family protein [Micromonosporaceae bacterium]|nr:CapA family protein [Micromonosporaceae bacterium]
MAHRAARLARFVSFVALGALAATGAVACSTSKHVQFVPGATPTGVGATKAAATALPTAAASASDTTFTLSAVGDTIMASAPKFLPPNGGANFFAPVADALHSDLQMANLEEPLTNVAASTKCGAALGKTCFAFRAPPSYADVLKDSGFDLVNIANNHAIDFGQNGHAETERALTDAGVKYTGPPGMITTTTVKGVRIAVVGFAPYPWANDLRDIDDAARLVRTAAKSADVVIVQAHMGAEGAAYQHVRPGVQMFLGENRGDAIAFSHAMIDAGASVVIGHGPHVLRGMEFYRGHLIAYSLGNFAGYHALSVNNVTGVSAILRVTMRGDGSFVGATIVPTSMVAPGVPRLDPHDRAIDMVRSLTRQDFPTTGAQVAANGAITPPAP